MYVKLIKNVIIETLYLYPNVIKTVEMKQIKKSM